MAKSRTLSVVFGLALSFSAMPAGAQQSYPNGTVTIVAPAAAGGTYGILGQLIADKLSDQLKKTFIVEYKPGAGTALGAAYVARAKPDGLTLLIGATPALAVMPAIRKEQLYDPLKDFTPIAMLIDSPVVLVVDAKLPIISVPDLVKLAKEKPGTLTFASNGPGSVLHLAGVLLQDKLDIKLIHVPYKGVSQALTDIAGQSVSMMFTPLNVAQPLVDAGKLRILGVSSREPLIGNNEIKPLDAVGVPGFDMKAWFMLAGPAGLSPDVVDKLAKGVATAMSDPKVKQLLIQDGGIPLDSPPPAALKKFMADEVVTWGSLVEHAGLAHSQ
jgi:tripartite-type tricarboxylate transporter receptor subunit TctC